MKNKRFYSFVLALIFCLSLVSPVFAEEADGEETPAEVATEVQEEKAPEAPAPVVQAPAAPAAPDAAPVPTATPTPTPTLTPTPTPEPEEADEDTEDGDGTVSEKQENGGNASDEVVLSGENNEPDEWAQAGGSENTAEMKANIFVEEDKTEEIIDEVENSTTDVEKIETSEIIDENCGEEIEKAADELDASAEMNEPENSEAVIEEPIPEDEEIIETEVDPEADEAAEVEEAAELEETEDSEEAAESEVIEEAEEAAELEETEDSEESAELEETEDPEKAAESEEIEIGETESEETEEPVETVFVHDFTTGTSDYTVEFYYGDKILSIDGGKEMDLGLIASALGIEDEIVSAESSESNLFNVVDGKFISYDEFGHEYELNLLTASGETISIIIKDEGSSEYKIGSLFYNSLQEAVSACKGGETIVLQKDDEGCSGCTIDPGKNITLNLNGKKITATNDITVNGGSFTVLNGTLNTDSNGKSVTLNGGAKFSLGDDDSKAVLNGVLNVFDGSVATINSKGYVSTATEGVDTATIVVADDNSELNVYGHVYNTGAGRAIETHIADNEVDIYDKAEINTKSNIGVYIQNEGTLVMRGGEVEGTTGIYFEGESMLITGGKVTGRSAEALYIDNTDGEATDESVSVTGGFFKGNAYAKDAEGKKIKVNGKSVKTDIRSMTAGHSERLVDHFISGGYYAHPFDSSYLKWGSGLYLNSDKSFNGDYPFVVSSGCGFCGDNSNVVNAYLRNSEMSIPLCAEVTDGVARIWWVDSVSLNRMLSSASNDGKLVLDVSQTAKNIDAVQLRTTILRKIDGSFPEEFTVTMSTGSVALDTDALNSVVKQAAGDTVIIGLKPVESSALSQNQFKAVAFVSNVVSVVDAYIQSNGQRITDLEGGSISISLSPDALDGYVQEAVSVMEISDDGIMTNLDLREKDGVIIFSSDRLSKFVSASKS